MRIYVTEHGRLGNQVLQYVLLRHWFPTAQLVFLGFEDLGRCFVVNDARFSPYTEHYIWGIHRKIQVLRLLSKFRIISTWVGNAEEKPMYRVGLFAGISLLSLEAVRFPNEFSAKEFRFKGRFLEAIEQKANQYLQTNQVVLGETAFMHIRRGDFVVWPSRQFPAVLSISWYKAALAELILRHPNIQRVMIFTDDLPYIQDVQELLMGDCERKITVTLVEESVGVELCLLGMLRYGILSASTFSWCGIHLGWVRDRAIERHYIAPKFWFDHARGQWPEIASLRSALIEYR